MCRCSYSTDEKFECVYVEYLYIGPFNINSDLFAQGILVYCTLNGNEHVSCCTTNAVKKMDTLMYNGT